jgi:hypothetical protein
MYDPNYENYIESRLNEALYERSKENAIWQFTDDICKEIEESEDWTADALQDVWYNEDECLNYLKAHILGELEGKATEDEIQDVIDDVEYTIKEKIGGGY